ncbi:MAG TPA: anti-sigma factor antagonist [Stellaceae bacterium]|jgi:anti-anti-sigma factor|nr:anti-sigma factor antagonist [Stellaceae bacterium]
MDFSGELFLVIANRIEEIAPLAGRIEGFLRSFGVPGDTIFRINLAVDELLTNIVSYGYDDARRHLIRATVGVVGGVVVVRIEDDGAAFDPFARAPVDTTAGIDDRSPGGLGIHLVKQMIEEVAYQRIDGGNRITLRHSFADGAARPTARGAKMSETTSPAVLAPCGRLDANTSPEFEREMLEELNRSPNGMVMDFSKLDYVSSAGLRVVLLAAKRVKAAGGVFVLCGLGPTIAEVFKVSGFLSILMVEPDCAAALARFV